MCTRAVTTTTKLKKRQKTTRADLVATSLLAASSVITAYSHTLAKHLRTSMMSDRKATPIQRTNAHSVVQKHTQQKNASLQVCVDGARSLDILTQCNRPKAFMTDGNGDDGGEVYANMLRVSLPKAPIPTRAPQPQKAPELTRAPKMLTALIPTREPATSCTTTANANPICFLADDSALPPPLTGTVRERFMADTGANRSIHPNGRAAASFY